MIDLFHENYPEYKSLLTSYMEERFYQPKVFVALSAQLRLIAAVFSKDISNTNRFWLTQTLTYLPTIIKFLRISFIQHQNLQENQQQNNSSARKPAYANKLGTTIREEDESRNSACFGNHDDCKCDSSRHTKAGSAEEKNKAGEPNMVDEFLENSRREVLNQTNHATERV